MHPQHRYPPVLQLPPAVLVLLVSGWLRGM
jgi:hypothetical protein